MEKRASRVCVCACVSVFKKKKHTYLFEPYDGLVRQNIQLVLGFRVRFLNSPTCSVRVVAGFATTSQHAHAPATSTDVAPLPSGLPPVTRNSVDCSKPLSR